MELLDSLVFDHCYISVPENDFNKLRELTNYFTSCKIQQVHSGDDMWEGIYLNTSNLSYVEIINEKYSSNRNGQILGQIAIAIHSKNPRTLDVDSLPKLFPDLGWNIIHRLRTKKRTPWFDAYSQYGESLDLVKFNPYFRSWAMKYHVNHPNQRIQNMAKGNEKARVLTNDLISIREIHYEVVAEFFDYLSEGAKWFPTKPQVDNDLISLHLPDRDGNQIQFIYKMKQEITRNKLTKVIFMKNKDPSIETKEIKTDFFKISNTTNSREIEFFYR